FEAVRGGGARRNGAPAVPTACDRLDDAVLGLTGYPPEDFGWRQMRSLGAAALDLCAVACGHLDAYVDCSTHAHSPWDYLGGMLVCQEAGASVAEAGGRELITLGWADRRVPVAAATREVHEELGIDVELDGPPVVVVDPGQRRVDVIFSAHLAAGSPEPQRSPDSPEITAAGWFPPAGLPDLLPEATSALIQLGRAFPPMTPPPPPGSVK